MSVPGNLFPEPRRVRCEGGELAVRLGGGPVAVLLVLAGLRPCARPGAGPRVARREGEAVLQLEIGRVCHAREAAEDVSWMRQIAVLQSHPHALIRRGDPRDGTVRSEERRVGKECVSTCRSRWSPDK